jgi:hypothetical protein
VLTAPESSTKKKKEDLMPLPPIEAKSHKDPSIAPKGQSIKISKPTKRKKGPT